MNPKLGVLRSLSFGERVAEDETASLAKYFVATEQWQRLQNGEIDIVYGHKGSGKSALYATLLSTAGDLAKRGILVVPGEDLIGRPVFKNVLDDPPNSEREFSRLWKLYFLQLIGDVFRQKNIDTQETRKLVQSLEAAGLLPKEGGLASKLRAAIGYLKQITSLEGVSGTIEIDPITGIPTGVTGKLSFREPAARGEASELVYVDHVLEIADTALDRLGYQIWILLDRLDVAFAESEDLEKTALRSLFKVYADFRAYRAIKQKIFLRTDIWERITEEGFREASHITRDTRIEWDRNTLMNLVSRRIVQSRPLLERLSLSAESVLNDFEKQIQLFYRIFPRSISTEGEGELPTFDWMVSRTADGTGRTAPRELIHLLNEARTLQLRMLEIGGKCPKEDALISPESVRGSLPEVSRARLHQTLLSEYPNYRNYLTKLKGTVAEYTPDVLSDLWGVTPSWALSEAEALTEIGFFERRGTRNQPVYWVPYLYRPALDLQPPESNGKASELFASALARWFEERGEPGVASAYLFGSHAEGRAHRESDVDVAVLLDWSAHPSADGRWDLRLRLTSELIHALRHNRVDLIVLNDVPPTLGRKVVRDGVRVFCGDPEADHAYVRDVQLRAADLDIWLRRVRRLTLEAISR